MIRPLAAATILGCSALAAGACGAPAPGQEEVASSAPSVLRPAGPEGRPPPSDSIGGSPWTRQDWEIFESTLRRADAQRLDTLPPGEGLAETGRLLLGTPYVPRTLEAPGPERLVVNLRGLDCVTFVENALALTRFHRLYGVELLDRPSEARTAYERELASLRYREGRALGYASRLHYFSEWLRSHAIAGRLELVTGDLGGIPDGEPVDFMSTHVDAYHPLADTAVLTAIRQVERELAEAGPRIVIPQGRIASISSGIRTGDIIAATSSVAGLDVAHTGLAVRVNGEVHLMHAPLVGDSVTISERTLARRIGAIGSQDGIMVARPSGSWLDARGLSRSTDTSGRPGGG